MEENEAGREINLLEGEMNKNTYEILYGVPISHGKKDVGSSMFAMGGAKAEEAVVKAPRGFIDYFIISDKSRWKAVFDIWIALLVGYSCFTTIYYVAFDPPDNTPQIAFDWFVEGCFFLDLFLHFFEEYRDPDTYEMVRDLGKIAKKYLKGWFIIDFIAVFPFQLMLSDNAIITKLFRLLRLPKLIEMLDISRFNKLLKSFFENSSRDERIAAQYILRYIYKIFRLILIAIIITYFVGCFWIIVSKRLNPKGTENTFMENFDIEQYSNFKQLIITCYFTLTTLSTVGYGDYYPVSNVERIVAVFIMLLGVAFFSYIMGNFIEIIANYDKKMGVIDKGAELQNWMTLLTRFTGNKPLPKQLITAIDNHFIYFWKNYRLASISYDDPYLNSLPKSIKRKIVTDYLFGDIFYKFKVFFRTSQFPDSKYLYDMAFGFLPRRFEEGDVIYREQEEVPEMYLILDGTVGVGYVFFDMQLGDQNNYSGDKNKTMNEYFGKFLMRRSYFGEYYLMTNRKSEFLYKAITEVKAIGIPKAHFLKVLEKHEEPAKTLRDDANSRYTDYLRRPLKNHRAKTIEQYNKMNSVLNYDLVDKEKERGNKDDDLMNPTDPGIGSLDDELDMNVAIKNKVEKIGKDIDAFTKRITTFADNYDKELEKLVSAIEKVQEKLNK